MKELMKKVVKVLLMTVVFATSVFVMDNGKAGAAVVYITVEEFSENLSKKLGLTQVNGDAESGYVNALIEAGIIKNGDFKAYTVNITRGDAMILLNRADEYLNVDTLDDSLVQVAIEKRISDIKKVADGKKEDVAKAYLKGFIKGYSNGEYSTDRLMKVTAKLTKDGAVSSIKMLKNKSLRAQISPDGQLIRTTNLPRNASKFPYILASFPNSYYEWKLNYEGMNFVGEDGEDISLKKFIDYTSPAYIDSLKVPKYKDIAEMRKKYLNEWVEKARKHCELIFSADYRTMDQEWQDAVMSTSYGKGTVHEGTPQKKLDNYVMGMKKNKTIVEYSTIAVDGSTLYYYNSLFYMRVYVKYRIVSSLASSNVAIDDLIVQEPYNDIILSSELVFLKGYRIGEWIEGYYDINMGQATGSIKDLGVVGMPIYQGRKVS